MPKYNLCFSPVNLYSVDSVYRDIAGNFVLLRDNTPPLISYPPTGTTKEIPKEGFVIITEEIHSLYSNRLLSDEKRTVFVPYNPVYNSQGKIVGYLRLIIV